MENLEKLAEFQLKNEEQLKIVGGNLPIDDSFATTQVGGGYCTSGGQDCQDAIYDDNGGIIGWGPMQETLSPNPETCFP